MKTIIDWVQEGNGVRVRELVNAHLYKRTGQILQEARKKVVADMLCSKHSPEKELSEADVHRALLQKRRNTFMEAFKEKMKKPKPGFVKSGKKKTDSSIIGKNKKP